MTAEAAAPAIRIIPRNDFDLELLGKLVTWAARDEVTLEGFWAKHFEGWGSWNQSVWAREVRNGICQTSYCIAGQAVAQKDFVLLLQKEEERGSVSEWGATMCAPAIHTGRYDDKGHEILEADESQSEYIEYKAREILGIDSEESAYLFDGDNDLERVVTLASYFARRRGLTLPVPEAVADQHDAHIDDKQWLALTCHGDFQFADDCCTY
jgi:hypothetical protein